VTIREIADLRRESGVLQRPNDERFSRIERILLDHSRVLAEHPRILGALPEAIRQKTGIRPAIQRLLASWRSHPDFACPAPIGHLI
jgi:hypothetical protein